MRARIVLAVVCVCVLTAGCADHRTGGPFVTKAESEAIAAEPIMESYFGGDAAVGIIEHPDDNIDFESFDEELRADGWYLWEEGWVTCVEFGPSEVGRAVVVALSITSTDGLIETIERVVPPEWAFGRSDPPDNLLGPTDTFECLN